jgi:outer membrane protein TolC
VAAVAGLTYQNSAPTTALDATVYYGGIQLQVPLFEGGLMRSETAEARSKLRQADLAEELLRSSVRSEVQEAVVNLQTLASVIDTARLQLEYAKSNYDAVEGLFVEGLVTSLSLIDAEQALSAAERELAFALYDQQLAILRVRKAVGTLERGI